MTSASASAPTLHLLGVPHTVTRDEYSHCAFTGKVLRFSPMMRSLGYHVIHYGNAGSRSGANEQVDILTAAELEVYLGGKHDPASPESYRERNDARLVRTFSGAVHRRLAERVKPGDIVCCSWGIGHKGAFEGPFENELRKAFWVETGVGYEETFCKLLVFDSYAWMHWHYGRTFGESPADQRARRGSDFHWVITNYYDLDDWVPSYKPGRYLAFLGEICEAKGLRVVVAIAKALPDQEIVICGRNDPAPWTSQAKAKNITYKPPIWGRERAAFLRGATALLAPTRYVEPFGLVAVEALLSGTPVLAPAHGGFTETVIPDVNGYLCRTLGDWLAGIELAPALDRRDIRRRAAERYDMRLVAHQYDAVFQQIVTGEGWFARQSSLARKPPAPGERGMLCGEGERQ